MSGAEVLDVGRDAILTMLKISAPLLVVGLVVGVAVSLVQALTQIQEMTLVFVPKIVAVFAVLILTLPFMGDALAAEMARLVTLIATAR
jgi:flagellar biosynthetic protein FliQ